MQRFEGRKKGLIDTIAAEKAELVIRSKYIIHAECTVRC
jgi:hypothetical protein